MYTIDIRGAMRGRGSKNRVLGRTKLEINVWLFPRERFLDPPPRPPLLSILYMTIFFIFNKLVYIFRIIDHVAAALGPLACASRSARPRHVAAALGPLACPSRSARPRKCLNLT